jgi:predicted metal-dependent phosphotriesterase family hydrolase
MGRIRGHIFCRGAQARRAGARNESGGYLSRVLLSQDSGWYHVGEQGGRHFRRYNFLFIEFLPLLDQAGVSAKELETLLIRNPRAVLTGPVEGGQEEDITLRKEWLDWTCG